MRGRTGSAARLAGALAVMVLAVSGLAGGLDRLLFPSVISEAASARPVVLPVAEDLTGESPDVVVGHTGKRILLE